MILIPTYCDTHPSKRVTNITTQPITCMPSITPDSGYIGIPNRCLFQAFIFSRFTPHIYIILLLYYITESVRNVTLCVTVQLRI